MVSSTNCSSGLKVSISLLFIFSLICLSSKTAEVVFSSFSRERMEESHHDEMLVGSRPPGCVNKCSSCRPCIATLIIPPHQNKDLKTSYHGDEGDSYYLLSWKCKCGNKLFHP